jgi:hypothetical protein
MKRSLATFATAAGTVLSFGVGESARAQEPTSSPAPQLFQPFSAITPPATPSSPASPLLNLVGEPTGDTGALAGNLASAPLRLSLQNSIFPIGQGFDQCGTREDAAGNSTGGIATQRYTLLRLSTNLVLHGFTRAGCPIDGAIGAGITYSVQVRPTLWLVAGAGIYTAPAPALWAGGRTQNDFRIDLVNKVSNQRSFSVGVGKRGVTFGGVF